MKAGLKDLTPHDLRHTAASMMIRSGMDVKVIMEALGHTSVRMTYDLYGYPFPEPSPGSGGEMDRLIAAKRTNEAEGELMTFRRTLARCQRCRNR